MNKVVIVEDDEILASTLKRRLEKREYQVELFNEVDDNLPAIINCGADVYLLDLRLNQMSGLKLIEPIRSALPDSKIIVMTGFASIATAVDAMKLGATDYLPKPLDFPLLLSTIEGKSTVELDVPEQTMSPERIEWEHIQKVLQSQNGNVSATARILGMHRRTLQRKLSKKPVSQ